MQELGNALGRFIGGQSDVDELRSTFRDYLRQQPEQREAVSRWVHERIHSGHLAPAILLTIGDLIGESGGAPSPTAAETDSTGPRAGIVAASSSEDAGPLRLGSVLDGRYTLVAELGHGGMGAVFKAKDRNREDFQDRHPYIALKVLSEEFKRHPDARMALQRETARAQSLAHPNVVTVYDFDYDGPHAYMTMELLEGQPLDDWLQGEASVNAPLSRRWLIVRSVGAGLSYAHEKGVVHSDLKPGNVFMCETGVVKVMDFGIARPLRSVSGGPSTVFDPAERLGGLTPAYASLEQWNHEDPDPRDDIYAFACVVYAVFSGRHPFASASAKTAFESGLTPLRIESLTRRQWEVLRHGLAFQRKDRIASIDEFLRLFAPRSWLQKYRLWFAALAAVAVAALLAVGARFFRDYIEDQFLTMLLPHRAVSAAKPLTPEQRHDVDDSLYMAGDTLDQAKNTKSIDDQAYLLSEGANNANQLLDSVLALDPSNRQALTLKANAVSIYESSIRSLIAANKLPDALRLVGYGMRIQPDSRSLFRFKQEICNRDPTVCIGN